MKLIVSVTNYSWPDRLHERLASVAGFLDDTAVDTLWVADHLLQADPCESAGELVERCRALADLGVQHVVVITRGRPLSDADLNCVAGAADQLAGLAHTPG